MLKIRFAFVLHQKQIFFLKTVTVQYSRFTGDYQIEMMFRISVSGAKLIKFKFSSSGSIDFPLKNMHTSLCMTV